MKKKVIESRKLPKRRCKSGNSNPGILDSEKSETVKSSSVTTDVVVRTPTGEDGTETLANKSIPLNSPACPVEDIVTPKINNTTPATVEPPIKRRKIGNKGKVVDSPFTLFRQSGCIADWDLYLKSARDLEWICPVDFFPHAPFSSKWKELATIGSKIEIRHPQSVGNGPINCVATVLLFAGYKCLIRFEKLKETMNEPLMAWISFFSEVPKPFGYSLRNDILLLPVEGFTLSDPKVNWKKLNEQYVMQEFGSCDLSQVATISEMHNKIIRKELSKLHGNYNLCQVVEVIDKEDLTRNRLGYVHSITGDRILVRYMDNVNVQKRKPSHITLNAKSEWLHPFGWSHTVGQELKPLLDADTLLPSVLRKDLPKYPPDLKIVERMVFEMRHPRHPEKLVAAYVKKKLNHGYFIAGVSCTNCQYDMEVVYHVTSDYVLPCGFCHEHNLAMEVPKDDYEHAFNWMDYCARKGTKPLDLSQILKKQSHKFEKGHKIEAVDVRDTSYLGPATVLNVAGHLLFIHFDGWPRGKKGSSQWISAYSPDIYPAGYAELVGHKFQSQPECPRLEDQFSIDQQRLLIGGYQ